MIKIGQIAYKNLWRKKTRTSLTVLGIALSTWVLVSLLGFNRGYEKSFRITSYNVCYTKLLRTNILSSVMALSPGEDPLVLVREILQKAVNYLNPKGILVRNNFV